MAAPVSDVLMSTAQCKQWRSKVNRPVQKKNSRVKQSECLTDDTVPRRVLIWHGLIVSAVLNLYFHFQSLGAVSGFNTKTVNTKQKHVYVEIYSVSSPVDPEDLQDHRCASKPHVDELCTSAENVVYVLNFFQLRFKFSDQHFLSVLTHSNWNTRPSVVPDGEPLLF